MKWIFILISLTIPALGNETVPTKCTPCTLGEGVCEKNVASLVCLVDSKNECPARGSNLYVLLSKPEEAGCKCDESDGLTKVVCITP